MKVFDNKQDNIFKLLSEAISEGIIIVNKKQEIIASNEAANIMFGYGNDELEGKPLNVLIPSNYHKNHGHHFSGFMNHFETRQMGQGRGIFGLRKDGTQFPVEAGLNPFDVYGEKFVMALVSDITIRKLQEGQIKDLNESLERKIDERTGQLEKSILELKKEVIKRKNAEYKMKESLRKERELNELKTKFLSLVSHEFKTPLSGILSSTTLLAKYTETSQQEKRDKHIKTIKSKVKYLDNILNDFLSVERLESGKVNYKFSNFPLSKVLNEVIYDANMMLKMGQKINYPHNIDEINLDFDEKILELIFSNLLRNAIKYSSEHSIIDIRVAVNSDELKVEFEDNGMGIPKKEQKFIFNRYFRAENALLNQGTGIGLNIVKSHLESLGGMISFESEEMKGSTFTIKIPISIN
jgi:PAS domain S-box-containing protein